MSQFITRVELHAAADTDYQNLHNLMAREGFSRQIVGDDGRAYQLPSAEYQLVSSDTLESAFLRAKRAAVGTGKSHWILVTESTAARWELNYAA